jgi:hypothetical protein
MKKWLLLTALACAGLSAVPPPGDACGRRRAFRAPCQPVVYRPHVVYTAPCPPVIVYGPIAAPVAGPMIVYGPIAGPIVTTPAAPKRTVVINGKTYTLIDTGERDEKPDEVEKAAVPGKTGIPESERYKGTSRRVAKTTIFEGEPEAFDSLAELLDSLPSNADMVKKKISKAADSKRVEEEQKNVRVTAWIYAFKKEPDNDYHVILGESPSVPEAKRRYMNVEVSGVPAGGTDNNRNQLRNVRKTFQSKFQLGPSGPRSYIRLDPPVPVRVTGSLFWDVDHQKPPFVGPSTHKPKTPWEIHPVSEIEFLP